ncbi:MAG: lysylphosphatidylglycerol synthase transmembrane domain-containing protein [Acholeplasma sp.]|nr:lysylphosphatidylglycerol synthase transmembrane domain-containing protein [Acholeplasma sp.]
MGKKNLSNKKYYLSFLIMVLLIVITFFVLFKDYTLSDVVDAVNIMDKRYILLAILMFFIYLLFEAMATKRLLNEIGYETKLLTNIRYAAIDYYFCAITPSSLGGQPMVAYYMDKDKIPVYKSSVVLLFNSIIFRLVLVLFGIVFVVLRYSYFDDLVKTLLFLVGVILNLVFVSIFLVALISKKLVLKAGFKVINLLHKLKVLRKNRIVYYRKYYHSINKFSNLYIHIKKNKRLILEILLYNILQRGALFFISYLVYRSLSFSTESIISLMAIQVFISITVDSLPIPGGVGLSEKLMISFFAVIYTSKYIFPAMVITRIMTFYLEVIITGLIIGFHHVITMIKKGRNNDRVL